jgi:invasion protein IalB
MLPHGVNLPSGVTLQLGQNGSKVIPFQSCNVNGCLAEYSMSEAEIISLSKGTNLMLSVRSVDNTPVSFNVPGAGFAAAYAKIRSP